MDKSAAVANTMRPKTEKEVRQFLGLAGYYRSFVANRPFVSFNSERCICLWTGVQWTEKCQEVFEKIKSALCGKLVLCTPDLSLPFCLQTGASDRGVGAVMSQRVEGAGRPVLYIGPKVSERESRYSTIEKESPAIKWAVSALRHYHLGRPFTLRLGQAPLRWLHRMKDTVGTWLFSHLSSR